MKIYQTYERNAKFEFLIFFSSVDIEKMYQLGCKLIFFFTRFRNE